MLYTTVTIDNKEYKCRLTTKSLVDLEKKLNGNPLSIFLNITNNELPKLADLLLVFHASLQSYNHGVSLDEVYNIYDKYIDEGHTFMDFIPVIMEIYKVSGLFQEEAKEETEKNA